MKKFKFLKSKNNWLNLITKKFIRKRKSKEKKHFSRSPYSKALYKKDKIKTINGIKNTVMINAPAELVMHSIQKQEIFMQFIENLEQMSEKCAVTNKKLKINFSKTENINPDACIYLIATVDSIKHIYPNLKFTIKRPLKDPTSKLDPHAILCHLGFYKLLGLDLKTKSESEYVKCWRYVSAYEADTNITEPLMNELQAMDLNTKDMYRGYIEGISNAVEHAYMDGIELHNEKQIKKWWMLSARINNEIVLVVCDKGHGIPKTLEFDRDGIVGSLQKIIGAFFNNDSLSIKASMLVKQIKNDINTNTNTGQKNRGKGNADIRVFINNTKGSQLSILSNKGFYVYDKDNDKHYNNRKSINGTILKWSIPTQPVDKGVI